MKLSFPSALGLSRAAQLAIVISVLTAIGVILIGRGWHVIGAFSLAIALLVAVVYYAVVVRPSRIRNDSVLLIHINDNMREDAPRSPLDQLRSRGLPTLFDIRRALEGAVGDRLLKAVVVELSAPGLGLATAQELHDLLSAVKRAGKRVIAILHGDNVSVRDYFAACGAGEIIVNPDTGMMMLGVAAGGMFLHQALENFGVQAQTLQWKEYKGAGETFTRQAMSPELRESLEAIISDWNSILAVNIADSRQKDLAWAREQLAAGFISAASAAETGLVDRLGYLEEVRDELAADEADDRFVSVSRYLRHLSYQAGGGARPRLALIHGLGPIVTGEAPMAGEFVSGERMAEDIRHAARDKRVKAIVFRVNSPGGSAVGSDLVWRAIRDARKRGKPVVVSMGDVAGSGGYYVAMGADAIVAQPATITGSVGVVFTKFSFARLMERVGIVIESAKSSPISDALSLSRTLTQSELAQVNQMVGQLYANFVAKFAEDRKLDTAAAEAAARGRVWSGVAAKGRGLVDELGGLARAVAIAREKAGLKDGDPHDLVLYPMPGFLGSLSLSLARTEVPAAVAIAASMLGVPARWAPALLKLILPGGVQALQVWGW
jgi:protease-4